MLTVSVRVIICLYLVYKGPPHGDILSAVWLFWHVNSWENYLRSFYLSAFLGLNCLCYSLFARLGRVSPLLVGNI